MATPAPIQGITTLKVGSTATYTDATPSGVWSSTNTAIATVNSSSGLVTAIAQGNVQIVYTVSSDSTAINLTVQAVSSLTNGFDFNTVYAALQNRVLWQSQGDISDSQRYYEDFHPLNDTKLLSATMPPNGNSLTTYLANEQRAIILEMLNSVYNARQIIDHTKLCFEREDTMLYTQAVPNMDQFVGIKMTMVPGDYAVKFSSLELFFSEDVTFPMYLYNDMSLPPIYSMEVTASSMEQVIVNLNNNVIMNYLTPATNKGGIWYFGYYQSDLGTAQALYYPINPTSFHPIFTWAYSAPTFIDVQGHRNFVRNNIGSNNLTYGLNIEMSTYVDATNAIVQNVTLFDELIGLMMAVRTVKRLIFAYTSNNVQRSIQGIPELGKLYAEMNGFKADDEIPYVLGLKDMVNREAKRVKASFQKHETNWVGIT